MKQTEARPIQALLVGLGKVVDVRDGDSVFFGRRKPPTVEELEARMAEARVMLAHEAAGRSR